MYSLELTVYVRNVISFSYKSKPGKIPIFGTFFSVCLLLFLFVFVFYFISFWHTSYHVNFEVCHGFVVFISIRIERGDPYYTMASIIRLTRGFSFRFDFVFVLFYFVLFCFCFFGKPYYGKGLGETRFNSQCRRCRICSVSHIGVTIWWPIYISRGFSAQPIQCEIARRFPRSVVKVGLNVQCKNISILSGVQPWTSTDLKLSYFNT